MSPVPVFSLKQNKARKLALSTMGFVWHINSSTMHVIREYNVYIDKCTYMNFDTSLAPPALPTLISSRTRTSRIFPPIYCKKFHFSLKCRSPLALPKNNRVKVGFTSILKTNTSIKDRKTFNDEILTIKFFYLKLKKREFLQ